MLLVSMIVCCLCNHVQYLPLSRCFSESYGMLSMFWKAVYTRKGHNPMRTVEALPALPRFLQAMQPPAAPPRAVPEED